MRGIYFSDVSTAIFGEQAKFRDFFNFWLDCMISYY